MNYLQVIILFEILVGLSYAFHLGSNSPLTMGRIAEIQTPIVKTCSWVAAQMLRQQPHREKGRQDQSRGAQVTGLNVLPCSQWKVASGERTQRRWR